MSQATNRATTNHANHKTAAVIPMTFPLELSGAQARTLWELATLAAYHPEGFTYTRAMEALCEFIADSAGSASDRAFCLARADQRERAVIAGYARRAAA